MKRFVVVLILLLCATMVFADDLNQQSGDTNNTPQLYTATTASHISRIQIVSKLNSVLGPTDQNQLSSLTIDREKLISDKNQLLSQFAADRNADINALITQIDESLAQKTALISSVEDKLIQKVNDSNLSAELKQSLIDEITKRASLRISDLNSIADRRIDVLTGISDRLNTLEDIRNLRVSLREAFVSAAQDNNADLKLQVQAARVAIARVLSLAIRSNPTIDFNDVNGLGQEIMVSAGAIIADSNDRIQAVREIRALINEKVLEIRNDSNSVKIIDGNAEADVDGNVTVDDNGLSMDGSRIKLVPSLVKARLHNLEGLKLGLVNGAAKYEADVNNTRNLLGFIPIGIKEKAIINAQTGVVESYERPWWSVIASGSDAVAQGETLQ